MFSEILRFALDDTRREDMFPKFFTTLRSE